MRIFLSKLANNSPILTKHFEKIGEKCLSFSHDFLPIFVSVGTKKGWLVGEKW